jgi:hypothetical protein
MRFRRRALAVLVVGLLVMGLALSACGGRLGHREQSSNGANTTSTSATQQGGQTSGGDNSSASQVISSYQDIQQQFNELNGASNDVTNADNASQENPVNP